jgi:hypothetical protein
MQTAELYRLCPDCREPMIPTDLGLECFCNEFSHYILRVMFDKHGNKRPILDGDCPLKRHTFGVQ